jgi:hypothetical protein
MGEFMRDYPTPPLLRLILLFSILITNSTTLASDEDAPLRYLSPPELHKLAEQSSNTYKIALLSELQDIDIGTLADEIWTQQRNGLSNPCVTIAADGSRVTDSCQIEAGCLELVKEAQHAIENHEEKEGLKLNRTAAKRFPDCFLAHMNVGGTQVLLRQDKKAIKALDKALQLNVYHYRIHFLKAIALARLGKHHDGPSRLNHTRQASSPP